MAKLPASVSTNEWTYTKDDKDAGVHYMILKPGLKSDTYAHSEIKIGKANAPPKEVLSTMERCHVAYLLADVDDVLFDPQLYPIIYIDPMYLVQPAEGFDESIKHYIEVKNPEGVMEKTEKFYLIAQRCPLFHPTSVHCTKLHVAHCKSHYNNMIDVSDSFKGPIWPDTEDWLEALEIVAGHQVVRSDSGGAAAEGSSQEGESKPGDSKDSNPPIDGVHWMVPVRGTVNGNVVMELVINENDVPDDFDLRTKVDCSIFYVINKGMGTLFNRQLNPIVCLNPNGLVPPADGFPESIKCYISEENSDGKMEKTEKFVVLAQRCPLHHPTYVPCSGIHLVHKKDYRSCWDDTDPLRPIKVLESFEGPIWPMTGNMFTDMEVILDGKSIDRDAAAVGGFTTKCTLGSDGTFHCKKVPLSKPSTSPEQLEQGLADLSIKTQGQEVGEQSDK